MSIFTNKKKSIPEDAVPATVEQAIPLQDIYEDGICLVGRNLYSKTYRFTDINYATASREDTLQTSSLPFGSVCVSTELLSRE